MQTPQKMGIWKKPGGNFVPDPLYVSGRKCWLLSQSWQEEVGGWAEGRKVEFVGELL